mmetsp:Transcript_24470/g.58946  ORF Transcript_24470/g.58946 Transcript_24470/m.58946 type:complete len:225 (-) Transcript_24470:270-944(-)
MVWICRRVRPRSADRNRSRSSCIPSKPVSSRSASAKRDVRYSSSSLGFLVSSSSSLSNSTSISKQSGTNSSYVTIPSRSTSTSCISRLISFRVSPKSASRMHLWNSVIERAPEPSASAFRKTSRMTLSSSSLPMPCSMKSCAAECASRSSLSISSSFSTLAYSAITKSTASGTNSAYVISPSLFTSASAITRFISLAVNPRSAIFRTSLNSDTESVPEPSLSAW